MSRKRDDSGRRRQRRKSFLVDDHEPECGPKRQTRLFADDDEYLQEKLRIRGNSEAALIRRWVRKGIRAERLERAARDPVVNSLLRVVNDTLGEHTARIERRLSTEFHTLRRLTATAVVLAHIAVRILEAYVASEPPPDDATLAARRKSHFMAFYQRFRKEGSGIMNGVLDERVSVLELLASQELITDLRDSDLDAALDTLKNPPGGPENTQNS